MSERVLAATTIGAFRTEIREYLLPEIPPDAGILKIEAAGVCGSDWQAYQQDRPPRIMGHENVGRIYRVAPLGIEQRRPRRARGVLAVRPLRSLPQWRIPVVRGN
jgi:threonine dehydrogenase-like Zn-dependent dehydrogenase